MRTVIFYVFSFAILLGITSCENKNTEDTASKSDSATKTELTIDDAPYNYNDIIKNQDSLLGDFGWDRRIELDLNGDGANEVFLAVEGYLRGMGYVLFTPQNGSYKLLSGEEIIPAGVGIEKLEAKKEDWNEFISRQSSGRGGLIESVYAWDGKKYIQTKQSEVEM